MTIIRVPLAVDVSPEDGEQIRFDTDTRKLFNDTGDSCHVDEPFGTKYWTEAVKWAKDNYPEG